MRRYSVALASNRWSSAQNEGCGCWSQGQGARGGADLLGSTHYCGKTKDAHFLLCQKTSRFCDPATSSEWKNAQTSNPRKVSLMIPNRDPME